MTRIITPLTVLLLCSQLGAQDVTVDVARQEPTYYVGEPAVIQFTVKGFDERPEPTCKLKVPVPGLRGQMVAANPSIFSRVIEQGGKLYRQTSVSFQIQYLVTADKPGDYEIGPFVIKQGQKEVTADSLEMSFKEVPQDPDMRVQLKLPDKAIYPDQRVPVGIEWWYAGDFENVQKLRIYSPLFDQFRFGPDQQPKRRSAQLPIDTKDGTIGLAAEVREETVDDKQFTVVSATRTLIPDRPGEFPFAPITATLRKVTKWEQQRSILDDFGFNDSFFRDAMNDRRRAARTELVTAIGKPLKLVVKQFPTEGRPESFVTAVGSGYSLEVAADRTVVRVGDPITLDIKLRGDGNIENASLPPLSADGGMKQEQFKLPDGDVAGALSDGTKIFRVSVRVLDEAVGEIPALAYSWFDTESEKYQTTRSKPIALRVMPAKVVSATDVVSASTTKSANSEEESNQVAMVTPNNSTSSLSGADLAIERDASVVLRKSGGIFSSLSGQLLLYAIGLLVIIAAVIHRKRREVDPELTASRKKLKKQEARVSQAANLPKQRAAEEVASAVRTLVAAYPDVARDEAQKVIAECESVVYSREESGEAGLDTDLIERAKTLVATFSNQQ